MSTAPNTNPNPIAAMFTEKMRVFHLRVLVIRSAIATGTRNAQNIVLSIRVSTDGEIVASISWRSGGKAVNDKRKEQGWQELDVFEVDVLDADDPDSDVATSSRQAEAAQAFQNKLSSTEIRKKQALSAKGRSRV